MDSPGRLNATILQQFSTITNFNSLDVDKLRDLTLPLYSFCDTKPHVPRSECFTELSTFLVCSPETKKDCVAHFELLIKNARDQEKIPLQNKKTHLQQARSEDFNKTYAKYAKQKVLRKFDTFVQQGWKPDFKKLKEIDFLNIAEIMYAACNNNPECPSLSESFALLASSLKDKIKGSKKQKAFIHFCETAFNAAEKQEKTKGGDTNVFTNEKYRETIEDFLKYLNTQSPATLEANQPVSTPVLQRKRDKILNFFKKTVSSGDAKEKTQ